MANAGYIIRGRLMVGLKEGDLFPSGEFAKVPDERSIRKVLRSIGEANKLAIGDSAEFVESAMLSLEDQGKIDVVRGPDDKGNGFRATVWTDAQYREEREEFLKSLN